MSDLLSHLMFIMSYETSTLSVFRVTPGLLYTEPN